jgi:hypothetical protein
MGGIGLYRKALPFLFGMMLGYFMGVGSHSVLIWRSFRMMAIRWRRYRPHLV